MSTSRRIKVRVIVWTLAAIIAPMLAAVVVRNAYHSAEWNDAELAYLRYRRSVVEHLIVKLEQLAPTMSVAEYNEYQRAHLDLLDYDEMAMRIEANMAGYRYDRDIVFQRVMFSISGLFVLGAVVAGCLAIVPKSSREMQAHEMVRLAKQVRSQNLVVNR